MINVKIIPEPHIKDKEMTTREDYLEEISAYMQKILTEASFVSSKMGPNDKLYMMFIGDIFDRGFNDFAAAMKWLIFFTRLNEVATVCSVVGNHEITYKMNNLFWLLSDNHSNWVTESGIVRNDEIVSLSQQIRIYDDLLLEDTLFIFGHYKRDLSQYTDKFIDEKFGKQVKNVVLLTHNELLNPEVISKMQESGRQLVIGRSMYRNVSDNGILPPTTRLTRVYAGHMHLAYGTFRFGNTIEGVSYMYDLTYLASLGRTSSKEVMNNFLDRQIPNLILDGPEVNFSHTPFRLREENEVLAYEQIYKQREKYTATAEIRTLKHSEFIVTNPVDDIAALVDADPIMRNLFSCAIRGSTPQGVTDLVSNVDSLLLEYEGV